MPVVKKIDEDKKNILFSLKYLANEAKREGYYTLFAMLNNAIKLEQRKKYNLENKLAKLSNDDDTHIVVELLLKFQVAPKQMKEKIIKVLENLEKDDA
jgi:hypothetical protein